MHYLHITSQHLNRKNKSGIGKIICNWCEKMKPFSLENARSSCRKSTISPALKSPDRSMSALSKIFCVVRPSKPYLSSTNFSISSMVTNLSWFRSYSCGEKKRNERMLFQYFEMYLDVSWRVGIGCGRCMYGHGQRYDATLGWKMERGANCCLKIVVWECNKIKTTGKIFRWLVG